MSRSALAAAEVMWRLCFRALFASACCLIALDCLSKYSESPSRAALAVEPCRGCAQHGSRRRGASHGRDRVARGTGVGSRCRSRTARKACATERCAGKALRTVLTLFASSVAGAVRPPTSAVSRTPTMHTSATHAPRATTPPLARGAAPMAMAPRATEAFLLICCSFIRTITYMNF